jgi:hypothetical protein
MKYFINPIGIDDNALTFFTSWKGVIVIAIFLMLLGITIHVAKRDRDIKKLIPMILVDCLVLVLAIVILTFLA